MASTNPHRPPREDAVLETLTAAKAPRLTSTLLALFRARASRRSPAELMRAASDPFVAPSPVSPTTMMAIDTLAFAAVTDFEPIELSPVAPLGTCSVLGPVDQNKVLSATRNLEVMADCTNGMALEAARRRATGADVVRLATSQRLVRAQRVHGSGRTQHFRIFGLLTAGRTSGSSRFELEALQAHVEAQLAILQAMSSLGVIISQPCITLVDRSGRTNDRLLAMADEIRHRQPDATIETTTERASATNYYPGVSFLLEGETPDGERLRLADGGAVDWCAKLLSNAKERCFVSGLGTQRLALLYR